MEEPPITNPDQNDNAARPEKSATNSKGQLSYQQEDPKVGILSETPFDELLKIKDQLGIYSPIALLPGFKQLIAVPFQKILIVNIEELAVKDLWQENTEITLQFIPNGSSTSVDLLVRVVRVCEYANPDDEYRINGGPIPTNTVLIEWLPVNEFNESNKPFGTFVNDEQRGIVESSQVENLIIQDEPPYNQPGPPVETAVADIPLPDGFFVKDCDFNTHQPKGIVGALTDPVVAVLDTGIKTRFRIDDTITHQYPDSGQPSRMRPFKLAPIPEGVDHQHGYSPITNYLRAGKESDPRSGLPAVVKANSAYWVIPTLTEVHKLLKADILKSPYDDHILTKEEGPNKDVRGRHGTTISAIINQKSDAAILPVKIFNNGGQGTLFDLLCGLNYVLACHRTDRPVRVVNLSFVGQLHYDAYKLLRSKFKALHKAGIWAVAAAGNGHRELNANVNVTDPDFDPSTRTNAQEVWNLFPACFAGDPTLSVLTVTTVQESPYGFVPLYLRSANLFWALIGAFLRIIFSLFNVPKNGIVIPVYKTVNNYGKSFVSVGVIEPILKVFHNASHHLNTTSFATAFFSAKLADYLTKKPMANRQEILDGLTFRGEMLSNDEIANNRLICYE